KAGKGEATPPPAKEAPGKGKGEGKGKGPNPPAPEGEKKPKLDHNPNFEADATAFEAKLGPVAFGAGAAVGPALLAKVRSCLEAQHGQIMGPVASLSAEAQKTLKALQAPHAGVAGGVAKPEHVQQLLMTTEEIDKANKAGTGLSGAIEA